MIPPLSTCRRSVKRICVNFALLCLSDIMIKILKESQFTVESESHWECFLLFFLLIFAASKMGSGLSLNEYLKLVEVMLFEKGYRSQFDLRPQNTRLPRTYLFRDSPSKEGKISAYTRLQKTQLQSNIKSYHDTIARWKPMHWIWLWATFKKNNQNTINAPTSTPVVQNYANYNSTGNSTTTSSQ